MNANAMKLTTLALAASIGLALCTLPAAAAADTGLATAHYSTAMTQLYGSSGPYTGALDLRIDAEGIVDGYYFPADFSAMYVPVVGGKTGNSIWLDIGSTAVTHVNARIEAGAIVGTAFTSANAQYTFVATPQARSAR